MRRLIRMLTVNALMCLVAACSVAAQTTPETPTKLPEHAKIVIAQVHVPITVASESNTVVSNSNLQEVNSSVSFLDLDPNNLLATFSEMLNEDAAKKAANSFESVRRNAMFNTEESLVSQYLATNSTKQSV